MAVSAVIESRTKSFIYSSPRGTPYTDFFSIYPANISRDRQVITIHTAVEKGLDDLNNFKGQPVPIVVYPQNYTADFDGKLLLSLIELLNFHGGSKEKRIFRRKTFRALDMAYYALSVPFAHHGNQTDHGLALSFWISAFETMAHPYPGGTEVHFNDVSQMIKDVPWHDQKLRQKSYRPVTGIRSRKDKTSLPVQIYGRCFKTRNHYLHGNPLPKNGIEPNKRKYWGDLNFQMPVLFRNVLLSKLSDFNVGSFPRKYCLLTHAQSYLSNSEQEKQQRLFNEWNEQRNYELVLKNETLR